MTGVFLILASIGLIAGTGLIAAGTKKQKAINFPNEFYDQLNYFKLDYRNVIAIKKNGKEEIVYEGNSTKATEQYFAQVQLGFENWLDKNKITRDGNDSSNVKFS
jgi:hypothetical protein